MPLEGPPQDRGSEDWERGRIGWDRTPAVPEHASIYRSREGRVSLYSSLGRSSGRLSIASNYSFDLRDPRSMSNFIGKAAPAFSAEAVMPDGTTQTVSLSDYSGQYVALFFYPKDFTFV